MHPRIRPRISQGSLGCICGWAAFACLLYVFVLRACVVSGFGLPLLSGGLASACGSGAAGINVRSLDVRLGEAAYGCCVIAVVSVRCDRVLQQAVGVQTSRSGRSTCSATSSIVRGRGDVHIRRLADLFDAPHVRRFARSTSHLHIMIVSPSALGLRQPHQHCNSMAQSTSRLLAHTLALLARFPSVASLFVVALRLTSCRVVKGPLDS